MPLHAVIVNVKDKYSNDNDNCDNGHGGRNGTYISYDYLDLQYRFFSIGFSLYYIGNWFATAIIYSEPTCEIFFTCDK